VNLKPAPMKHTLMLISALLLTPMAVPGVAQEKAEPEILALFAEISGPLPARPPQKPQAKI